MTVKPKPLSKPAMVAFRLNEEKKELLATRCKKLGISQQQFIESAMDLRLGFPEEVIEEIEKVASETGLGVNHIMTSVITKQVAFEYAWLQVFGKASPGTGIEIQFDGRRLITGDALLKILNSHYVELLQNAKDKLSDVPSEGVMVDTSTIETVLQGL